MSPHILSLYHKTEILSQDISETKPTPQELNLEIESLPLLCLKDCYSPNEEKTQNEENFRNIIYLKSKLEEELDPTIKLKIKSVSDSIQFNDTLFYIYTSGTTGLPKPAIIKHSKFILASIMCKHIMGMKETDVLYTAGLPLCHTLGTKIFMQYNVYLNHKTTIP